MFFSCSSVLRMGTHYPGMHFNPTTWVPSDETSDRQVICHEKNLCNLFPKFYSPFPQIDIIEAMTIVWRVRGKIMRSVLCNIVCNSCAQCNAHTYEQI